MLGTPKAESTDYVKMRRIYGQSSKGKTNLVSRIY